MQERSKSEPYEEFAQVYDLFMDDVPYKDWAVYLTGLLAEYGITDGILLELACGTGKLTRILAGQGYDMIGIDYAQEMLEIARQQATGDEEILYLHQDMREFELYGTVRAVVSICDSMNYILKEEELLQVFRLVNNYLDPRGIFIFDLNTIYKYREVLGEATICENREEGSFIWENFYDAETNINECDLTLFIKGKQGLYHKYEETHQQRGYCLSTIQELLSMAGMEFIAAYDERSKNPPKEKSGRIHIVAREHGK
ncbi:class I SAM-dependent methyltransferase [Lachnospiraceae bacterium ZAX-1]